MASGKDRKFFYGYVIAAACFGIQAVGIGTHIAFGVFFKPLIAEFGWTRAAISGAQSLALFLAGFLGIFIGRLNDRFGPRRIMAVTGIFFGLGLMLMSGLESIWQLYLFYGIVFGIGLSSIDVISLSTAARWFRRRRGAMTGIVKVGTGAGQLVIPMTASLLIVNYGWSATYLIIGALGFIFIEAISQLLRRDPAQMGLLPDGDSEPITVEEGTGEGGFSVREALHTRQFWMICATNLLILFCLTSIMVHIVPHAQDIGISATAAAGILATIGGASMVGRFVTGIAIDQIGNRRTMIACVALLIAAFLWLQTAGELWMLYLFALIYSFAHGGVFTVFSPIIAEFFGIRAHGILFGISMFIGLTGGAIGPIVAGHIFDITGEYSLAFWICILISSIGLVMLLWLKPVKR